MGSLTTHRLEASRDGLHGRFDRELAPVLTIEPGDTVRFSTLDASWGHVGQEWFETPMPVPDRNPELDSGHALTGPVYVNGARPGQVLEVEIGRLRPGAWGWTWAGPYRERRRDYLGLTDEGSIGWRLDAAAGVARDHADLGVTVPLRPFMGVMGNAPAAPGDHSTAPPRRVGGNLDCRELVTGSVLWLPIEVEGALFSVGDGHGAQGDGEVGMTAIECPMEEVELTFRLGSDLDLRMPRAQTPAGMLTFGLGDTVDDATVAALEGMLDYLEELTGLDRPRCGVLASLAVHLRITQVVNGTVGVHALLPPDAFELRQSAV